MRFRFDIHCIYYYLLFVFTAVKGKIKIDARSLSPGVNFILYATVRGTTLVFFLFVF